MFRSLVDRLMSLPLVAGLTERGLTLYNAVIGSRGGVASLALFDCLIVSGMSFVTLLLLGHFGGSKELGIFTLVMTVFYLLLAVQESLITMPYTVFGIRWKGTRHSHYSGAVLGQSLAWSVFASSALAIAAATIFYLGKGDGLHRVVAVFAIVLPVWSLREFGRRYMFANMEVAKVVVMSAVGALIQFIAICLLAYTGRITAVTALLAMGLASAISASGWLWYSRSLFRFNRRKWSHYARKNWDFGSWILASHAMAVVAGNVMPWLIVAYLGASATGVFAACDAILRFANPIITSLNNVLTPRLSIGFNKGGKEELHRIVLQTTGMLALFLLGFCAFLTVAGKHLLNWSFGPEFDGYWLALVTLAASQLTETLGLATSRALMVLNRASLNLYAEGVGLSTSFIAAMILIPRFGIEGAALAHLSGSIALAVATAIAYLSAIRDGESESVFAIGRTAAALTPAGGTSE